MLLLPSLSQSQTTHAKLILIYYRVNAQNLQQPVGERLDFSWKTNTNIHTENKNRPKQDTNLMEP